MLLLLPLGLTGCSIRTDSPAELGNGITLSERTDIEDILQNPVAFDGKTVAVQGKVVGVCERMGCWMDLESPSSARIRVKVEDGKIVFPVSLQGKMAIAEGVVEKLVFTPEEFIAHAEHHAEMQGEEFDPSQLPDPPYEEIRISATGARVIS